MPTRLVSNGVTTFRLRRSPITTNGTASPVEAIVKRQLDELNELLGKPLFRAAAGAGQGVRAGRGRNGAAGGAHNGVAAAAAGAAAEHEKFFALQLTPKHVPATPRGGTWAHGSLGAFLQGDGQRVTTLSDHIDKTPELAQLKYAFLDSLHETASTIPFESKAVLDDHANIADYLIAHAYYTMGIRDQDALRNVILNNRSGTRVFADYAVVSAARWLIQEEQLKVDGYNDDDGAFVTALLETPVSLSALSFQKSVRDQIRKFVFDRDELRIIKGAAIYPSLPESLLPDLVKFIQQSSLKVTAANVNQFLPGIVLQLMKQNGASSADESSGSTDEDFRVQFQDDTDETIEVSRSAVRCAAQLFHGMVLGEELDVFGAVHYLAHRRMNTNGGMRIENVRLREDLQRYVFDNVYLDLGDKRAASAKPRERFRTRPAERQMFHRQVFDQGAAEMPEGMLLNPEFKQLWKILMLESARYLDRAQASLNPDSYVSRQNVMQAVEDLQYNLSTHCTGMATVISPSVDAELNFVLERILKHPEMLRQVLPEGGSWKRALDRLNGERRRPVAPATTLYNKALYGKRIIEMIADYEPAAFEGDEVFSDFISKVDSFITTQSILERPKRALEQQPDEEEEAPHHDDMPELPPSDPAKTAGAGTPADEWDF
jgi:hypothetical protein